jgi:hypothetical protein
MAKRAPNRPPFPSEHPKVIAMRKFLFNYAQRTRSARRAAWEWFMGPLETGEERGACVLREYGARLGSKRKS